jgi:hypothetical protein
MIKWIRTSRLPIENSPSLSLSGRQFASELYSATAGRPNIRGEQVGELAGARGLERCCLATKWLNCDPRIIAVSLDSYS